MPSPDDARRLAEQVLGEMTPEQQRSLIDALVTGHSTRIVDEALATPAPAMTAPPARTRGVRVRLDLVGAKPPVWRRLELPGDLRLDVLHRVLQAAMGWTDTHLHRFRTGSDHRAGHFLSSYDVEEGEQGVPESDVRLDQVVAAAGDRLWYEYDFGDGWEHVLTVEQLMDDAPAEPRCIGGRMACPPEDCGGIWGYAELAEWVRGGCDPAAVPQPFDDAEHARTWLRPHWHPDRFDVAEANEALAHTRPLPVAGPLADLLEQLGRSGDPVAAGLIARLAAATAAGAVTEAPDGTGAADPAVSEHDAARMIGPFLILLDVVGDGIQLTKAGKLPPATVTALAEETGIAGWWIGKVNREDQTWPVALLREAARSLGLVTVRSGRLSATAIARKHRENPLELWRHLLTRLPKGTSDFDREAGWLSLAVVAAGTPAQDWREEIAALLTGVGWRAGGDGYLGGLPVYNPTLDVLEVLAGRLRHGGLTGSDPAVAATARAVILRR
ncbi:plasmid pRiA4b ORF-3 family protein [Pseudactinotalea sp. HY160]|uniref:plasmid pRiA4b ORF-3 family protein n=1 Tax=Pseudactinotalea sp. HY160 TaxID=2654490 RepID=UPI00128DA559|nr:plasmid pRiA4b ORF-3 family protein [Pseudactinotalea sp. HY160]MPV51354.1 plasmid pRiA4b ORF-3 family protein [Pseudactinotalea sp. HY160]